jgi:SSS family transporter
MRLSPIDLAIVAVYLVAITIFGLRFSKQSSSTNKERSLKNYFLADNVIPWWAIALSIVSAETSTLTIVSIPGVAFAGDFGFLQVVLGYMLGRCVVALLFLPRYFRGEMLTAYQLIDRRFGHALHKVTAGLFLVTRAAAEGVRVFAISIVVGIAIGTGDILSIGLISLLTLLYTFEGGLAAVIWTDVVQMALYVAGTVVALFTLGAHVPGNWPHIWAVGQHSDKFHMLNFALNLTTTYTFWAGALGGCFLTMASHGTDQLMVQRMLAARNLRDSQLALLASGAVIFVQFTLFLLIGVGLFVFYSHTPGAVGIAGLSTDRIFPTFIVHEMPHGVAGLLVAAILAAAMSNLSAALNSLASTSVVDFYMPLRPHATSSERTFISRAATLFWAVVLFGMAVYSIQVGGKGHVVETGLSIASVAYGGLLGVFLLGTLTRYATQTGAILGMICGFAVNLTLWLPTITTLKRIGPMPIPHIAYTWYVLIGSAITFAVGTLGSLLFRKQSPTKAITAALVLILAATTQAQSPSPNPVILSEGTRSLIASSAVEGPAVGTATSRYPKALALGLSGQPEPGLQPLGYALQSAPGAPFLPESHPGRNGAPTEGRPSSSPTPNPVILSEGTRSLIASSAVEGPAVASTTEPQSYDFSEISKLLNQAIAEKKLPGAVVLIGHNGKVVFEQAYGNRKLAGEPGIDGKPSPAEPMTEDTIFDMASLTKVLVTGTAILQLYEAGKLDLDAPVAKYLPDFAANGKQNVTIRELLTHTSGLPPDIDLKDSWGLTAPDRAEGIRRAIHSTPTAAPGTHFEYSDVNFITLGVLVEKLSGEREDRYAFEHIFQPLKMDRSVYHGFDEACGPSLTLGSAILFNPPTSSGYGASCHNQQWLTIDIDNTVPTAHDDEGTAATNPNFDHLLRGTVHDPSTRRMGGVAGHAGVFSTAADASRFCQALLDKLLHNTGPFPLKQSTLKLMTTPQQPKTVQSATIFTPDGKPTQGIPQRGLGWDINSAYSRPRGEVFPIGSFGHTGFTGTSLWLDPASDTYVILLSNSIHPRGAPTISTLRGQIATAAARALGVSGGPSFAPLAKGGVSDEVRPSSSTPPQNPVILSAAEGPAVSEMAASTEGRPPSSPTPNSVILSAAEGPAVALSPHSPTLTGIDVLESTHFAALHTAALRHAGHLRIGLLTNQTGLDAQGKRTVDILAHALPEVELKTIFTPEHGLFGKQDTENPTAERDAATNIPVLSLYGSKPSDKHPKHEDLAKLDAVVIDLQDAGVRFYTYETIVGYFVEATGCAQHLDIIVLDRPTLTPSIAPNGPTSDPGLESYVNYMPEPSSPGMTLGELAQFFYDERGHICDGIPQKVQFSPITVIPVQNWTRTEFFDDTRLPWVNPSPNLKSATAAILYPGVGLTETTNISVGRGTATPFEHIGAPWIDAKELSAFLTARKIPGVTILPTTLTIAEDANKYPSHGQTIPGIRFQIADRRALDAPELGIEILSALHHLYPQQFQLARCMTNVASASTLKALEENQDPRDIARSWQPALAAFRSRSAPYLLYPRQ